MKNREPDLDVHPEDWERESSRPRDLEMEYRENRVRVEEQIKAIQDQLIRQDDRITRIESNLVKYLWGGIGLIFTAAVAIIVALISRGN